MIQAGRTRVLPALVLIFLKATQRGFHPARFSAWHDLKAWVKVDRGRRELLPE
jgi:hypothetical protein